MFLLNNISGPRQWHPIFLYGWIHQLAIWSESCVLIDYPSGQDGPIVPWHRSGFPTLVPASKRYYFFTYIVNPLLTKLVVARRINIGLVLFCIFYGRPIFSHLDLSPGQKRIYIALLLTQVVVFLSRSIHIHQQNQATWLHKETNNH